MEFVDLGVIYDEGKRCSMKGFTGFSSLEKITEDELEEIMNDFDPIEAPPGPYTVQPGKKGKDKGGCIYHIINIFPTLDPPNHTSSPNKSILSISRVHKPCIKENQAPVIL